MYIRALIEAVRELRRLYRISSFHGENLNKGSFILSLYFKHFLKLSKMS